MTDWKSQTQNQYQETESEYHQLGKFCDTSIISRGIMEKLDPVHDSILHETCNQVEFLSGSQLLLTMLFGLTN